MVVVFDHRSMDISILICSNNFFRGITLRIKPWKFLIYSKIRFQLLSYSFIIQVLIQSFRAE